MRKVILILLVFISAKVNAQVYQEMPQYGYRANRMAFDSTLQIPTVCGVPTLKSVVKTNKSGAIAYDSCNARFYAYNPKTLTWTAITSGSTDTTSLSNRINLKIDSLKRSSDTVYAYKNGTRFFQYKDSIGSGGNFWKTSGTTDLSGEVLIKNSNGTTKFQGNEEDLAKFEVIANDIDITAVSGNLKFINIQSLTDTSSYKPLMISSGGVVKQSTSWVSGGTTIDTTNQFVKRLTRTPGKDSIIYFVGGNRFAIKDSVGNTSGFVPYTGATSNVNLGTKNITANAYFNGFTSMFAKNDTIVLSIDSTPVHLVKGTGGQAFKLPVATTLANGTIFSFNNNQSSGAVNVLSNSIANTLVKSVPSGAYLILELTDNTTATGIWDAHFQIPSDVSWSTNTLDYNGSITSAQWNGTTVAYNRGGTGQSSTFTQGGIIYGSTTTAMASTSVGTSGQILKSNGLSAPSWINQIDTTSLSNRINDKLAILDTSNMLSKYLRKTDTATLSNRINLKLNIADTSTLQYKSISAYTILANKTSATANVTAQAFRDTSGVYDGTITWTGTTAPSGATNHTYRLTQVGKCVTINISLLYATNGLAISKLTATLPSNAPTPVQPTGLTSALQNIYVANGQYITSTNTTANTILRSTLRNNTSNNGFEFLIEGVSNTVAQVNIICQYWTN